MARIVLNTKGVREMLKSDSMRTMLNERAEAIKDRCGEGYEVDSFVGKTRVNAALRTKTKEAVKDNSENNTLLKAVR